MLTIPITDHAKERMGKNTQRSPKKWFPHKHNSQHKKERNSQTKGKTGKKEEEQIKETQNKKWIIFTYHSPLIRKVTILFKNTNIKVAFRASNTVYQQLVQKTNSMNPSGVYEIKCNTCSKSYVGQSGRPRATRHKEHIRYIKTNNPVSAYAAHILNNRHECGTANDTLKLIQPCKSMKMNYWENMCIQIYRQQDQLITEQQINQLNPLYELAQLPHTLRKSSQADHQQTRTPNTHR